MRFTGTAQDINGHPLAGLVDITFAIDAESIAACRLGWKRKMSKLQKTATTPRCSATPG